MWSVTVSDHVAQISTRALSVGGSGSKLDPESSMRSLRGPVNWDDARISENVARSWARSKSPSVTRVTMSSP